MIQTAVLGYPRIGQNRELKKATEAFWRGEISEKDLEAKALEIKKNNWKTQKAAGIDIIPSNDFSSYDHVLDAIALLGAVPKRFSWDSKSVDLNTFFSMARGTKNIPAMEMTKWFNTNYHYIVPEFYRNQRFMLSTDKPFKEFKEALSLGIKTRPVLLGPVTFLLLGKVKEENMSSFDLLGPLVDIYIEVLSKLKSLEVEWLQMDEPALATDLNNESKHAFRLAYKTFSERIPDLKIMLTSYFGPIGENLSLLTELPVKGIHLDLVYGHQDLDKLLKLSLDDLTLSLGVVNGRNIWKADLEKIISYLESKAIPKSRNDIIISSSCSLIHVPIDLDSESDLDNELKSWFSFAKQKLYELNIIKKALEKGKENVIEELRLNKKLIESRVNSKRIYLSEVRGKLKEISKKDLERKNDFNIRQKIQKEKLKLPIFPTTTIGSFPQTLDIRRARAKYRSREITKESYTSFVKEKIKDAINRQNEIGLDVLVHGEPERNDMVEYFAEMLLGFAFTKNGWVQSYGTRCVKPPIIYGDVKRKGSMTLEWIKYAQSLAEKPVKGMLTGPVTILLWSFVRDDQDLSETARQIALALRDEVKDLEAAGISIVQIDEPAIREGLPLRKSSWKTYLRWAVDCFKLVSSPVKDETQIHTHMCYSEFNDIIDSIAMMDADVISIEASRSKMELLDAFRTFHYPNEIGPGVYDVHSPSIPTKEEIKDLLKRAAKVLPKENIWVNPDCGLKTRGWEETIPALKNMVSAAKTMREAQVGV